MEWTKISLTPAQREELRNAEEQVDKKPLLKRLQCIRLKDKGWKHEETAEFLAVSINSITNWLKAYREGGVPQLLKWEYRGKVSVLSREDQEKVRQRNREQPFMTAKAAQAYIEQEFGIKWHLHWVQKLLKKNFVVHSKK